MVEVASKKDFAPGKQVQEMQYIGCNRNLMIIQFVAILYGEGYNLLLSFSFFLLFFLSSLSLPFSVSHSLTFSLFPQARSPEILSEDHYPHGWGMADPTIPILAFWSPLPTWKYSLMISVHILQSSGISFCCPLYLFSISCYCLHTWLCKLLKSETRVSVSLVE